ncbi:MAG: cell filamentation protein Fic [Alphaproteobacteria bacterium]|nr:cell filamentation protein Fic [Alphaproteobacteria bacterium]
MYNKRQELILSFIKDNPNTKREDIEIFLSKMGYEATKMTITRDLKLLLENNEIKKSGLAKATVYSSTAKVGILSPVNIETYFAKDQDERLSDTIGFNFDIFSALKNLLSAKEKFELEKLNNTYIEKKKRLSDNLLQKEFERLTVELAWKSSKIEGNTYTLLDTERLLNENISAKGKTKEETNMVLNHKKALDFILKSPEYYKNITIAKIEDLHKLLVDELNVSTGVRNGMVGIVGTNYKPLDNTYQIKEALKNLIDTINKTDNPVEKALISVLMLAYIQPFEDGNKRTSRILGNAILLANGYCPLSYRSVDEIEYKKAIILFYEQNNVSYFKELFIEQFKQAVSKYF